MTAGARLTPESYEFLRKEIYRESGLVLGGDKHYLLEARLSPVVRGAKLASLEELCMRLRAGTSPGLTQQVVEALTTNETLFFRDMVPFDVFRQQLLPEWMQRLAATQPLRIWSAAASSGQEAYSIAMLVREREALEPPGVRRRPVEILGTDISEQILSAARIGRYVQFEVNRGLPAPYLVKYFDRTGLDWQVREQIRSMVVFRRFDLRQTMAGLGRFQIIFCRNVLIYFDAETKTKILKQIATVLEPGGYLLLGAAESVVQEQDSFERVTGAGTSLYRRR